MKALFEKLARPKAFRIVSMLYLLFLIISVLGDTGSYLKALHAAVTFYSIWALGRWSADCKESQP